MIFETVPFSNIFGTDIVPSEGYHEACDILYFLDLYVEMVPLVYFVEFEEHVESISIEDVLRSAYAHSEYKTVVVVNERFEDGGDTMEKSMDLELILWGDSKDSIVSSTQKAFAVYEAVRTENMEVIQQLSSTDQVINQALRFASYYNNLDIIKHLVSVGADVEKHGFSCIKLLDKGDDFLNIVRYLISVGSDYSGEEFDLYKWLDLKCPQGSREEALAAIDMFMVNKE